MDRKIKDTLKIVAVIVVAAAGIWGISSLKKFQFKPQFIACAAN